MQRFATVSVVIPVYNEAQALPRTHARLLQQAGDYAVIVVDGGSSDCSVEVAQRFPGVRVITSTKGRAVQMNAGAAEARGDWLLFFHADTESVLSRCSERHGPSLPSSSCSIQLTARRTGWQECRALTGDELFLLNSSNKASFDSRYFGPVKTTDVRGRVTPLWTWSQS